jgi:hypothetical protein
MLFINRAGAGQEYAFEKNLGNVGDVSVPPVDEPNFKLSLLVLDIYGMVVETLKVRLVTETKISK